MKMEQLKSGDQTVGLGPEMKDQRFKTDNLDTAAD
jgi:hypothetical protein